jgi:hypothetical protein
MYNNGRVLWFGGAPRAGKSTAAKRLAETRGFEYFNGDAAASARARNAPESSPAFEIRQAIEDREARTRFFCSSAQHIADTNLAWAANEFELVKNDITTIENENGVVVDAFLLPPSRAAQEIDREDVMFLFSTEAFQRERWKETTWFRKHTDDTDDPELAVFNFTESGIIASQRLMAECEHLSLPYIVTGGALGLSTVYERVCEHFALE